MGEHVSIAEQAGVIAVTFDRQDKLNAIDAEMFDALAQATRALCERPDLRVLVIQAVGRYFTAGLDLGSDLAGRVAEPLPDPNVSFRHRYRRFHQVMDELEAVEKPVVLAAQGPCLGLGVEIAASCDFRLAAGSATFGVPEVTFNGLAGSGGASRLTRIIGPSWAKWLSLAAQTVDAYDALRIGLVQEVTADADFTARVHEFAHGLAGLPSEGVGLTKLVIDAAVDNDRVAGRHLDRIAVTTIIRSHELESRRRDFGAEIPRPSVDGAGGRGA